MKSSISLQSRGFNIDDSVFYGYCEENILLVLIYHYSQYSQVKLKTGLYFPIYFPLGIVFWTKGA